VLRDLLDDLPSSDGWVLGSSPECSLHLDDPSGRVSRRHAVVSREGDIWTMTDLGSTNGIRVNREDRRMFQLAPGDEIELGGITLIAESRRSMALSLLLRRLLGWSGPEPWRRVDGAFREVREMAHSRTALILHGEGSLLGVAHRLHRLTLGDRPFVALGPGDSMTDALEMAVGGMVFVEARHLPRDLGPLAARLREPAVSIRLVAGAANAAEPGALAAMLPRVATIAIPPLRERPDEMDALIEAYGRDAVEELGAPALGFRPRDVEWARLNSSWIATLDEIEDAARRLVAMRNFGVTAGAERLGITHGALSRWAKRRGIPT
jgi:pSer/pThr/pTyr-binding forkhead associated (FHA) protein